MYTDMENTRAVWYLGVPASPEQLLVFFGSANKRPVNFFECLLESKLRVVH